MKDHFRGYQNLTIGKFLLVNKIQQIYNKKHLNTEQAEQEVNKNI